MRQEREFRSLPLWLAREYLLELGGRDEGGEGMAGDGWRAVIRDADDVVIGALHVGRIYIDFDGDEAAMSAAMTAFDAKALRAGG